MTFCPDKTEVFFKFLGERFPIKVSQILCEINLPFLSQPLTIRWYGAIIAFGLLLAVLFGGRTAYKWKIDVNKMIDILIWGMIAGVIGARAYYVVSQWSCYADNPISALYIWEGGLAIYGGLIGGLLAAIIVCIVEKINILNLLDLCSMSFLIGQGIGRWGNFANQEAFGCNTDLPWGMKSAVTQYNLAQLIAEGRATGDPTGYVHPTFFYESAWCLLSFAFIYWYYRKFRKFSGQLFLLYGILYGLERTVVEGLRTDSLYITGTQIRTSQLVSIILFAVCSVLFVIFTIRFTKHPKPIEGIDYFKEIPVYNKRKKALDAKLDWEKTQKKADEAPAEKKEKLQAAADKKKAFYEKCQKESDEHYAALDAKKAEKARRRALKKGIEVSGFDAVADCAGADDAPEAENEPASSDAPTETE